ncbi:mitogen-activated protein kinase binding protein 1 [Mortierella sp. GBA30]|nr:mitogen-activated protein kinase binding protein 1 [Mortierella sp. GBA30]
MLKLERVLGLTSNKPMVLSVNPMHDLVAYAAGCVVVLYSHKLDKQVGLLCSATLNKASAGSGDSSTTSAGAGSGLNSGLLGPGSRAIGSHGSSPRTVGNQWMSSAFASANINPLAGLMPMAMSEASVASSFGISNPSSNKNVKPKPVSCLSFSPDGQYLAIGESGHQPRILVWEVASQTLVGEMQGHKFGVQAVKFSPNSKHLVSLGFQHDGYIHVWNWRTGTQIAGNKVTTKVNALTFSADGSFFVTAGLRHIKFWYLNIGSRKGGIGAASNVQVLDGRSGILGEMRDSNYVDAVCSPDGRYTYAVTSTGILCQFSEGRVMEKWVDLHARGAYSVNLEERSVVCACTDGIIRLFEPETLEYISTLPKPQPVGAFRGTMHESAPELDAPAPVYADVLASQFDVSSGCLICIYSDRSLAVWDIVDHTNAILSRSHIFHSDCVWGAEIIPAPQSDDAAVHPFPTDTFVTYSADGSIKFWNLDESTAALPPVAYTKGFASAAIQQGDPKRAIRGRELQIMDPTTGESRVHALSTLEQLTYQEAHDTEILAIDFTDPLEKDTPLLVATAGRDRLLHVFDVLNDFSLVQTLDDHSSSIACIQFTADGSRMMSCGADKSIIFRNCIKNESGIAYQPYHQAPGRGTFYDMVLHHPSQAMAVVSADRRFNVFALDNGKAIKSFKAETKGDDLTAGMAEVCSMTHISLDPSGTIAAASGSDKSIRIYDLIHGTCLAHMICHAELVTSVKFMHGCDRIVSTSADGCVLIWRLSRDIVRRIQARVHENVTVPSYIKAKSSEVPSSPSMSAIGVSPRATKLKRSTDRLAERLSYASENSGASRRNSITSLMSDDFDVRSDICLDSWNDQQQGDDASQHSFHPVTAEKSATTSRGVRSRVATGSSSRTPLSRSRQSTASQPVTPKAQISSSRSTAAHPELPPWNRSIVQRDRIAESPTSSTKSSRPSSPRQRVTKTSIKGKWLATTNARPRATSLTVPHGRALHPTDARGKNSDVELYSLSDHASSRNRMSRTAGDVQEDELSDEAESGFEDGQQEVDTGKTTTDDCLLSHSNTKDVYPRDILDDEEEEEQGATEGDLASEERDDDDEEADEDDSISETGSDIENISALQRHTYSSPDKGALLTGGTIGHSAGFQDGELLLSPQDGGNSKVTSPTRITSMMLSSSQGRRSLSAKFLTAHAAAVMLGLVQRAKHENPPATESATDSAESLSQPLEIGSACVTPKPRRPTSEAKVGANTEDDQSSHIMFSSDVIKNESICPLNGGVPLEERLNPRSLNVAVMKWKQRSQGTSGPLPLGQGLTRDGHVPQDAVPSKHGFQKQERGDVSGLSLSSSNDYAQEVVRTRKGLMELGYLTSPSGSGSQGLPLAGNAVSTDANLSKEGESLELSPRQGERGVLQGVLASPAILHSSVSSRNLEEAHGTASGQKGHDGMEDTGEEENLQHALERISALISRKVKEANTAATGGSALEQVKKTKEWLKEARSGLLDLVGETQGQLWALESKAENC